MSRQGLFAAFLGRSKDDPHKQPDGTTMEELSKAHASFSSHVDRESKDELASLVRLVLLFPSSNNSCTA